MKALYKNQQGFTLIELMVVVGIIGILAAIAIPNFSRYQAKARQSEAKIALAGIYTAEKSFYSEYSAYSSSLNAVGYAPEGQKRNYAVGFADLTTNDPTYSAIGYNGDTTVANYAAANNTITGCTGSGTLGSMTSASGQSFVATANGCIARSATFDIWNMTDNKLLSNNQVGINAQ